LEEDFAELQRAVELLEAERLRRLAEIDRRGLHGREGFLSAASWLASSHKVAWGNARAELRIARALRDMPRSLRALQEGEVSMSAIKVLAAARQTDPSAFDRSEPQLLEAARVHAIGDLQRVVGFWRQQSITLTTCEATMPPARGGGCTPPRRTWGWSVSTATSTPRPAKRS
jgi:hypothetical protein